MLLLQETKYHRIRANVESMEKNKLFQSFVAADTFSILQQLTYFLITIKCPLQPVIQQRAFSSIVGFTSLPRAKSLSR